MLSDFKKTLIDYAKKEAKICLTTGEKIRKVPFAKKDSIFVSTGRKKVVAINHFILEGQSFFVGTRRK